MMASKIITATTTQKLENDASIKTENEWCSDNFRLSR